MHVRRGLRAALVLPLCAAAAAAVWFSLQSQASGAPEPKAPSPARAIPAGSNAAPQLLIDPALAERARTAATGRIVARADRVTVDELPATGAKTPLRLSIQGRFPLRALDPTVLLDGTSLGRAVPGADLRSLRVVLPTSSAPRDGAIVSYRYGTEPAIRVGTLHKAVR